MKYFKTLFVCLGLQTLLSTTAQADDGFEAACLAYLECIIHDHANIEILSIGELQRAEAAFEDYFGIADDDIRAWKLAMRIANPSENTRYIQAQMDFDNNDYDLLSFPINFHHNPAYGGLPFRSVRCSVVVPAGLSYDEAEAVSLSMFGVRINGVALYDRVLSGRPL
ncbi:hypothetical protein E2K80_08140 [Rhodophyticola sp. CCM32]|uniref:hypothetical protein n=1 Tax=Rhodophyticola sp. CCM32 TaxID=2916397 RepID=UPI00107F9578|nr:hypothetical protein [Rhodophyticola sp. CCM32]QBY00706.1 hypothetical protein E2K80_08140 [Rhodophyticola sp. CCM32]